MEGEQQANSSRDIFLFEALYQADGFDGELTGQAFYDFIVGHYGVCPYTVEEIDLWLNVGELNIEDVLTVKIKRMIDGKKQSDVQGES